MLIMMYGQQRAAPHYQSTCVSQALQIQFSTVAPPMLMGNVENKIKNK